MLTHVAWREIDTGTTAPVTRKLYRYEKVKQGIIDYYIRKMLADDIIMSIVYPFGPQWCCVGIANITSTDFISTLDLISD